MLGGAPDRVNLAHARHMASHDRYAMIARARIEPAEPLRTLTGKQLIIVWPAANVEACDSRRERRVYRSLELTRERGHHHAGLLGCAVEDQ
jgi:hypothetical protein